MPTQKHQQGIPTSSVLKECFHSRQQLSLRYTAAPCPVICLQDISAAFQSRPDCTQTINNKRQRRNPLIFILSYANQKRTETTHA